MTGLGVSPRDLESGKRVFENSLLDLGRDAGGMRASWTGQAVNEGLGATSATQIGVWQHHLVRARSGMAAPTDPLEGGCGHGSTVR
jgi:hypothetical protein